MPATERKIPKSAPARRQRIAQREVERLTQVVSRREDKFKAAKRKLAAAKERAK